MVQVVIAPKRNNRTVGQRIDLSKARAYARIG
jgi:hypothetical protein